MPKHYAGGGRESSAAHVGGPALPNPQFMRERLGALRNLPPFIKLVWQTSPAIMLGQGVLRLLRALLPVASLYVGALIIDEVVRLAKVVSGPGSLQGWISSGLLDHIAMVVVIRLRRPFRCARSQRFAAGFASVGKIHECDQSPVDGARGNARPRGLRRQRTAGQAGACSATSYDPDERRILLDGHDLREYDLFALRSDIGVIFQDFVRYHLTVAENIAVGRIDAREDRERITLAAQRSLADEVIAKLPDGYDQVIGRRFKQGVELSGGEWQKIAIARAYMRDAQLLILDEPTAALDARAEFQVFQRFKELSQGKTAVLISHRFSWPTAS